MNGAQHLCRGGDVLDGLDHVDHVVPIGHEGEILDFAQMDRQSPLPGPGHGAVIQVHPFHGPAGTPVLPDQVEMESVSAPHVEDPRIRRHPAAIPQ